jgi:hypothetical protein
MKRFLSFLTVAIAATALSCTNANSGAKPKAAEIKFAEAEHDFGTIEQNSNAEYSFVYKNIGKEPLVVSNVQTSCGCTIPDWTKDPVKKNGSGVVKVHYNTHAVGGFTKTITVHSNASNTPVTLTIKGVVVAKPEEKK